MQGWIYSLEMGRNQQFGSWNSRGRVRKPEFVLGLKRRRGQRGFQVCGRKMSLLAISLPIHVCVCVCVGFIKIYWKQLME